jgi:hypothetical protein
MLAHIERSEKAPKLALRILARAPDGRGNGCPEKELEEGRGIACETTILI